jgi:hypothetical protein
VLAGRPGSARSPATPARRFASSSDRCVARLGGAVVIGHEALSHGSESQLGRRLAQASAELARERACGDWWLPMAAASRGRLRSASAPSTSDRAKSHGRDRHGLWLEWPAG